MGRVRPPCQGGQSTGTYAGGESWRRGCMPGRGSRQCKCIAAATGREWGRSSCRGHAATVAVPGPRQERRNRVSQAVRATTSQTVPAYIPRLRLTGDKSALFSSLTDEAYIGSGERQALSTPSTGEPEDTRLAGTYPYSSKQSNPALLRVIRLQLRCNPDPRRNVRTRFFHRICMPAGPMERAPV